MSALRAAPHRVAFADHPPVHADGASTHYARAYHLLVAWSEIAHAGKQLRKRPSTRCS